MKMKEAEKRTGLDRKNIRYYESEELLAPARAEGNRYRDYSEEDISRLLEIKLLRQLGIPIKDIRGYFEGNAKLGEIMQLRRSQIDQEMEQLKKMGQICASLEGKSQLCQDEIEQFLNEIQEAEKAGFIFQNIMRDWKLYKRELHETFIYIEAEGELLTPTDFARETALYAEKNQLSYETIRLENTYALVRLDGIMYQASYTCIRFRFAEVPMVKLTRCNAPKAQLSLFKYILFSLLPMLLIGAGIAANILGHRYFPDYPRIYTLVTLCCFIGSFFSFAGSRNVHYLD